MLTPNTARVKTNSRDLRVANLETVGQVSRGHKWEKLDREASLAAPIQMNLVALTGDTQGSQQTKAASRLKPGSGSQQCIGIAGLDKVKCMESNKRIAKHVSADLP